MLDRAQFKAEVFRRLLAEGGGVKEACARLEVRLAPEKRAEMPTPSSESVLGNARNLAVGGAGLGFGLGFLGRRMFDPGPEDIKEIGNQQLVDEYKSQAEDLRRQKALRDLAKAQGVKHRRLLL